MDSLSIPRYQWSLQHPTLGAALDLLHTEGIKPQAFPIEVLKVMRRLEPSVPSIGNSLP